MLLFALITLLAALSRFYLLSDIPTSLAHDEMIYAINAQSVAQSGTDITGTWDPFSLTPMNPMFAELPTIFQAPFFKLPIEPVIAARLPFVLMSLVLPFVWAGIAWQVFQERRTALITGVLVAFNPWVLQFSRMGFDSYWSLFFLSIGGLVLLSLQGKAKLWSLLPFFLGFYQYQGHKLAFLPWITLFVLFIFNQNLQIKQQKGKRKIIINWKVLQVPLIVLLCSFGLFFFYVSIQLPKQESSGRISTMLTPNSSEVVDKVNERRRLSLATPLTHIVINKYLVWGEEIVRRYVEIYNPRHLFLASQYASYNVWSHGLLYILDFFLIVFGILSLWGKKNSVLLGILFFGLATAVIPAVIGGGNSYVFRPSMSIPLLLLLAAVGAGYLWQKIPKIFVIAITLAYVISILLFAFQYFVRYPVYAAESHYFSDKVLSQYFFMNTTHPVVVYSDEPEFTYTALLFYNDLYKKDDPQKLQDEYRNGTFHVHNWRITDECVPKNVSKLSEQTSIVRHSARWCDNESQAEDTSSTATLAESTPLKIGAVKDSGVVYTIYHDQLCDPFNVPDFIHVKDLDLFDVKNLDSAQLCSTWFM